MFLRLSRWVKKSGSPNFQPPWIKIVPYFSKNWGGGSWFLQGWWFVNVCDLQHRCQSDRNGPSFAEVLEYVASLNRRSVRLEINWGMLRKMQCIRSVVSYDRYGRLQESIVCFCLNIVTIPLLKIYQQFQTQQQQFKDKHTRKFPHSLPWNVWWKIISINSSDFLFWFFSWKPGEMYQLFMTLVSSIWEYEIRTIRRLE